MKLTELETMLEEKGYQANYVEINNKIKKQNRVYLDVDKNFVMYFFNYEDKPFLNVFITRDKSFDYSNYKQTDEEKEKCRMAKYKVLKVLAEDGITGIESYSSVEATLLSPQSKKKRLEL